MKTDDFYQQLQELHDGKILAELYLHDAPTYKVIYVLGTDESSLTYAEVGSNTLLTGVAICSANDIDSISIDSAYLNVLSKRLAGDSVYLEARKLVKDIKEFNFENFIDHCQTNGEIVDLVNNNIDSVTGKIVGQTENMIILDEYSTQSATRLARTFLRKKNILRISIHEPWLKTIAFSLSKSDR